MPQLNFQIVGAEPVPFAATPTIGFKLKITNTKPSEAVHAVLLQCQIQIESTRRCYQAEEQERLFDLFGEQKRWGQTLRAMLWTNVSTVVPAFTRDTLVNLLVPCSFDFNVAATRYFAALRDGEVPLCLLFNGPVFFRGLGHNLLVEQLPWEKQATYRLPIAVWQKMMYMYYPNENWLTLRSDVFHRLAEFKRRRQIPTWEQTMESLLSSALPEDDEKAFAARRML